MTLPKHFAAVAALALAHWLQMASLFSVESPYFAYISGNSNTITCYRFDPTATTTATILTSQVLKDVGSPSGYMAWSPDRTHMYTLASGDVVAAYSIDVATGTLTHLGTDRATGGSGSAHLCVHPSGKWVFVANYTSGHVGTIPVKADGSLDVPLTPVLAGVKAHMVLTNRAGTRLYVPCLGSDYVKIYQINAATGALSANTPSTVALATGAGPRHMDFNSDESRAYVINEVGSTMTAFTHNPATGAMTETQTITTLPTGFTAGNVNTCAHVLVSNDDHTLYGSNRGAAGNTGVDSNDIVSFRIAPSTGTMTLLAHDTGGGEIKHPRDFTLDPTGTVLLAASRDADLLTVFRVTPSTGVLSRIGAIAVSAGPIFVGVMPKANAAPTVATAAAVATSPVTGTTATVSVLGADDFGEAALTYAWNTVGSPPAPVTFSATGTLAAKNATATFTVAGSYQLCATITDAEGATVTSTVSVRVNQTFTSLRITPSSAALTTNGPQTFTAIRRDQFAQDIAVASVPTWSVSAGGGTITTAGLFTSAATAGTATVTALDSGKTANATVTMTAPVVGGGGGSSGGSGGGGGGCGLGSGIAGIFLGAWWLMRLGLRSRRRQPT